MARKVNYQAPFDRDGNLQHYPQTQADWSGVTYVDGKRVGEIIFHEPDWREVVPFRATMTLESGVTSGRSAKYVHWRDQDGHQYPMFVSELVDLVTAGAAKEGGVAEGMWIVCKRGANYGIRYVREEGK